MDRKSKRAALERSLNATTAAAASIQERTARADQAVSAMGQSSAPVTSRGRAINAGYSCLQEDVDRIRDIMARLRKNGSPATKSQVLRAAAMVLARMGDQEMADVIGTLPELPVGRPKGS